MPFACAARRKSLLGVAAGRRTLHCHGRKAYARHDVMVHHGELDAACSRCSPLTMQPVLLREIFVKVACSCVAPLNRTRMPSEGDMLVLHWQCLHCMWTDGGARANREQDTQERVRGRGDSKQWKQGLLSVHGLGCVQHRAAWHAYLLVCSVSIWSCTWQRARMTCNADDGRERRAPGIVSAKGVRGCVRTGASRCVADPQHLAPPLFRLKPTVSHRKKIARER